MKKRRMILLVVSVVTILILAGVGVTYSLLSSVTPTATNTFQSDKEIKITLTEPNWQEHGKEQASAYVPGQVIDKDPTVTLSDNSVSSYVALKVQYYDEENELSFGEFRRLYLDRGANDDQMGIDFSGSWVYIGTEETDKENDTGEYGKSVVYMYKNILTQDDASTTVLENVTEPLFTNVHLSADLTQDENTHLLPNFNIKVTAYAVQAYGISMEEAKTALNELVTANEL